MLATVRAVAAEAVPPDSIPVLPPIIVTAPRPDARTELMNRPGFVAMVDLSKRTGRVEDLSAILSQLVGVRVTQYGGLGSFATVSIRGSSSSQVRTFLDGVPIDDPYLGVTNLADLPLGGVDRVEVYRGFSPPSLGGAAIGGAVHLVTRTDGQHDAPLSGLEMSASAGSFETRRETASLCLRPGPVRLFAHGTHEHSKGRFDFDDDNGTPENVGDDEIATRANNDFDALNGILRASASLPRVGEASVGYYDASRDQGVPGLGSYQSTSARSERRRRMGQFRLDGTPLFSEQLQWSTSAHYHRANEQFHDPDADVSLVAQDTDNTINAYGGSARVKWFAPFAPFAVEVDGAAGTEQFSPISRIPTYTEGPDRWRRATTLALGSDAYLFAQKLVLSAMVRFEHHVDEFGDAASYSWLPPSPEGRYEYDATSPSFGARWQARSWLTVKGNVGRYYRLPTFLELFGNVGSVTGNAELVPERGVNRDVGVVMNLSRAGFARSLFLEVSYFDNHVDDLILFFPNSQSTAKPTNIGAAHIRGLETSASAALPAGAELAAGYTYLDTEDASDIPYYRGNTLPSRPSHDVNASLSYAWRALHATYELHYVSANFLDRANLRETPTRDLHALSLTLRTPVEGASLTVEGRNLTDEQAVDVAGFPLPGRSVYSTLSYRY